MKKNNSYGLRSNVLRELSDGFFLINNNFKYFKKLSKDNENTLEASEWLLDNIYLIEKEYKNIKSGMPFDYFKSLPELKHGSNEKGNNIVPYIFEIAKSYINDGKDFELESIIEYVNNIQDKDRALTMGELWAFPLMLRIGVILNLAKCTKDLVNNQKDMINGANEANRVINSIDKNKLHETLENINFKYDTIGPLFIKEFFKILIDNSVSNKEIYTFAKLNWNIDEEFESTLLKASLEEENLEKNIGIYITYIRKAEGISWRRFFEETSLVEKALLKDPSQVYEKMDFHSKDFYRHKLEKIARKTLVSEIDLANEILEYANIAKANVDKIYKSHVGYYLIDEGVRNLKKPYVTMTEKLTGGGYFLLNVILTLFISYIILLLCILGGARFTRIQYIVSFLMILNPVSEIIIALINWSVGKIAEIRYVPKLDLKDGILDQDKAIIVIPAITNSKERIIELMEQLEVIYCGNTDKNLYFALLNDFNDSKEETGKNDEEIIKAGIEKTKLLNEKYSSQHSKESKFFFLSRQRIFNEKQGVYMGHERKRGKLMEFIALIRGKSEHTFNIISSDIGILRDVKYLITLDADTFMPRESAFKLVGAMSHVLNKPCIKEGRVTRGYGIMQPKVSISLEAKNKTYFSRIFAGESGVDGYSVAHSDTYQDLFGEGSFTGKGIIEMDTFYEVLNNAIKENTILSHDLLEGGLARCALVSDIEFIDGYPAYYESSARRLHRWTRGDWQLIRWLFSRNLTTLYKWKIVDNLRRSLLSPNILIALILTLTVLRGSSQIALLCFLGLMVSLVFTVTDLVVTPKNKLMGTFKSFEQIVLILTFIPYAACSMLNAIVVTLYRVFISKKNLLEWESSEYVEKVHKNSFKAYLRRMWISPVIGLIILYLSFSSSFGVITYNVIVSVLWIISPYVAYSISKTVERKQSKLNEDEISYLRQISRRIWSYYEDFINEENNYLAPDNYQEKPFKGVANRTSPTNIGMGLISNVAAYDFGYITLGEFIEKIENTLTSMRELQKINGHYLNWYDTKTREPLWPRYISTVDSGNLLGNLWIVKQAVEELKKNPVIRVEEITSLRDIYKIIESENSSIKIRFNSSNIKIEEYLEILNEILLKLQEFKAENIDKNHQEIKYWLKKLTSETKRKIKYYEDILQGSENLYSSNEFLEGAPSINDLLNMLQETQKVERSDLLKGYLTRIDKIIDEINLISANMDFKFLYNKTRGLFSIGYNVEEDSLGNSYYDLLASESRIASFIGIAKNDIPNSHWFKLSRGMTNAFYTHSLVSWSGTMFEYFMPSLIMRNYPTTLLSQTYKGVIKAQKVYAKQKKIPWGISESAFYEFDVQDNYQYKAFGVPGLGLKRGLEDEIVISPYSTLMTIQFTKKSGIKNLRKIEDVGALGRYGFIESIDYTKARGDNYIVEDCENVIDKSVDNYGDNVDKLIKTNRKLNNKGKSYPQELVESNPQTINNGVDSLDYYDDINRKMDEIHDEKTNLNDEYDLNNRLDNNIVNLKNDGIKPNKVRTYMVHHLGMSFMALDNVIKDNILINRFHNLPEIKATELLLKEKIPSNIMFEREEDFSIKNKYFKGEPLIPRTFEGINYPNQEILLLSNGQYSSMITIGGSGYSKKEDMMLYRWKGDSTSDNSGLFFYIKELNSNKYWSAAYEPCKKLGEDYTVELNLDKAKFNRKDGNIETQMEIIVAPNSNFEIRKLTLKNIGNNAANVEVTSYMEIILTEFSADTVHPAFSSLFIETEYDEKEKVLIGNRRGRVKGAKIPYIFHKAVVNGDSEGSIDYETSRLNFIGRNRELNNPIAMDKDTVLDNTVGTVLDPIMSLRVKVELEPKLKKEIYYITGVSDSKEEALELVKENSNVKNLEMIFTKNTIGTQLELKNLGIKSMQANLFQALASYIFFFNTGRKDREKYIENISKHQKDLWAFGISGDLPIILIEIKDDEDIGLISNILKFHYYLRLKKVKTDLIIYNNEEISYEAPLQKTIMHTIIASKDNNLINKSGGVFVHNKSTMNQEVRDLLIGISRIYIDSKKGTLLNQINQIKDKNSELELNEEDDLIRLKLNSVSNNKSKSEILEAEQSADLQRINNKFIEEQYKNVNENKDYNEYDHDQENIESEDIVKGLDNIDVVGLQNKHKDFAIDNIDFFNGYGGFSKKDNSYLIKLSNYENTPAPWINVISNKDFGFHISESGSAYTWCGNSRENKITPWSNDYVRDPIGEAIYIRDNNSGKAFSITPKPMRDEGEYLIKHSFGYSEFIHKAYDIEGKLEVFSPMSEKLKIQKVILENLSSEARELSIFYYAQLVLGVHSYESAKYISTELKENYICGRNPYSEYFGNMTAYLTILGGEGLTFTGDRKEFIGLGRDASNPEALEYEGLSNRCGGIYDPCLVAETKIKLEKGEKKELLILFGEEEQERIEKIIEKYKIEGNAQRELNKVKQYWINFLGNIQVKTPDDSFNHLVNGWLLYQNYVCRYLSRTAFYQSGGAYGFRDQLQDSMSIGIIDPSITKSQILRSASRQYIEGDVQHWWHPVVNSGIRTRFSDDLLWLPYVTADYINSTGDYEILEEKVAYLEDEPLKAGEDERYTIVNQSSKEGTIYEHCLKAIEKALKFGAHNIPLMGSGDWNDGMSTVGNKGKGESVWLGWFIYSILDNFIEIAKVKGDNKTEQNYIDKKEFIKENIDKNAWDGEWYKRAYFDNGTPLGSKENPECKIDSIAQSWSIISGATKVKQDLDNNEFGHNWYDTNKKYVNRALEAMKAVDKNLVKEDKGIILLLTPPFNNSYLEPGYIKGYVPGVRENGGQYTHAAAWVILALTKLGFGDKAVRYYNMINPINHTKTKLECSKYKLEPYVMAADVYMKEPHGGRGGWSWYTGTAGWMYKIAIENILGLRQIKGKGYIIDPCIPETWKEFEINIKNQTEDYDIKITKGHESGNEKKNVSKKEKIKIVINGEIAQDKIIPKNAGKLNIEVYLN